MSTERWDGQSGRHPLHCTRHKKDAHRAEHLCRRYLPNVICALVAQYDLAQTCLTVVLTTAGDDPLVWEEVQAATAVWARHACVIQLVESRDLVLHGRVVGRSLVAAARSILDQMPGSAVVEAVVRLAALNSFARTSIDTEWYIWHDTRRSLALVTTGDRDIRDSLPLCTSARYCPANCPWGCCSWSSMFFEKTLETNPTPTECVSRIAVMTTRAYQHYSCGRGLVRR